MGEFFELFVGIGAVIMYLTAGTLIGRYAWSAWRERKNRPRAAFLMFPVSYSREQAGHRPYNFVVHELRRHRGAMFLRSDEEEDRLARNDYLVAMALCWPLKLVWNPIAIVVLLATGTVRRPTTD